MSALRSRVATAALLSLLAGCTLLTGCTGSAVPSEDEQRSADYGMPPVAPETRVIDLVRQRYADRNVVHVTVGTPKRGWIERGGLARKNATQFGWSVPFRGMRLGFARLDDTVVQGYVFFRDDRMLGVADEDGFEFLDGVR